MARTAQPERHQPTRRQFVYCVPAILGGSAISSACSEDTSAEGYEAVAQQTWRLGCLDGLEGLSLSKELVRYATLAPSSHNTQCWKFAIVDKAITILPDMSRRTPAVDPDDHHLFVSLGCSAENLVQAALAHGLAAEARFDAASDAVRVTLAPIRAQATPLFKAIAQRQCTRGDYDSQPLSTEELHLLERAGNSDSVRVLLLTERKSMEQVLAYVVQGNTAQMNDPAFVAEPNAWIRFNDRDAPARKTASTARRQAACRFRRGSVIWPLACSSGRRARQTSTRATFAALRASPTLRARLPTRPTGWT